MPDSIFLLRDDDELVSMTEEGYVSEDHLQDLLARYPQLLSGEQVDPKSPRRWLLILREAGIPDAHDSGNRWAVDHLFLDQDGVPTLVEVKRSTDSRIRREVVGQMLDYAANAIVYWPHDSIRQSFEKACQEDGRDSSVVVEDFLAGDTDEESFWQMVRDNLQAQRVRLVFVADRIPPELQRIVEFLNGQMERTEVLALEVKQFKSDRHSTLVPRVLGRTAEAQRAKGDVTPKNQWDEVSFFAELARRHDETAVAVARKLLAWARGHASIWWGKGARSGSFVPVVQGRERHQLFAVYTYGSVEIYFQYYAYKAPFDREEKRREILDRLNATLDVDLPADSINRRPSFPLAVLSSDTAMRSFCSVFEWFLGEVTTDPR